MIYLATPYSHSDAHIRQIRFLQVTYAAGQLMQCGYQVYSPITSGHPVAEMADLPKDITYWKENALHHLAACDKLVILTLEGWNYSAGVEFEYETFVKMKGGISDIVCLPWRELI